MTKKTKKSLLHEQNFKVFNPAIIEEKLFPM